MNGKKGKSFYRIICNILTSIHSGLFSCTYTICTLLDFWGSFKISPKHMYIFGYNFSKICTCIYGQKTSKEGEVGRWWCFWHGPLLLSSWVPYLYFHQAGNLKDFLFIMWQLKLKFLMMFNGHQRDRCKKQICLAHVYVHVTMVTIHQI